MFKKIKQIQFKTNNHDVDLNLSENNNDILAY